MNRYGVVIAGGGPAGTGVLLAAMKGGRLDALLDRGVCVVERGSDLMRGSIGDNAIDSDTLADVLLECLDGPAQTRLAGVLDAPAVKAARRYLGGPLPLRCVGDFLAAVGDALRRLVEAHPRSRVICGAEVAQVRQRREGYEVTVRRADGGAELLHADAVVSALGGHQQLDRMLDATIAPGVVLGDPAWRAQVMPSSRLLTEAGMREADARLAMASTPSVVVIGSSHSAVSSVRLLLERSGGRLGAGAVTLLVRRPPRVFYRSVEEARADGYKDFDESHVCTTTGRVHQLAGLRLQARQCARELMGLDRERREERVNMVDVSDVDPGATADVLERAHLVVAALGYRPRAVKLVDRDGERVAWRSDDGRSALVDRWCRALDGRGEVVRGVYAVGLASGFVPWGPMGGEPGFVGQTNGIWLYQHHVGALIVDQLLGAYTPGDPWTPMTRRR